MPITVLDAIRPHRRARDPDRLCADDRRTARRRPPAALLLNLFGAVAILVSLYGAFNLSAAVMEGAWALVALLGLLRYAIRR